jgi:hypothetical protein
MLAPQFQQPQGYAPQPQQMGTQFQQPQGYAPQGYAPQPQQMQAPAMPGAPSSAAPQMTPKASGVPYEAWRQQGWTDQMLRAEGMML